MLRSWVGYTGGDGDGDPDATPPTYERVCARNNTFTEAVRLEFDPSVLPYTELVRRFASDARVQRVAKSALAAPAAAAASGDGGARFRRRQTRVAIWARDGAQAAAARGALADAGLAGVVPILPPSAWHDAEEYHQDFLAEEKDFPSWSADPDDDDDGGGGGAWGDLGGPGTAWGL